MELPAASNSLLSGCGPVGGSASLRPSSMEGAAGPKNEATTMDRGTPVAPGRFSDIVIDRDRDEDENEDEEEKTCEICHVGERKYKCPRCFLLTCSLACCKKHKADSGCDGRRDRAAFVSMNEFSDKHIKNDFHFLEDVLQSKGRAQRTLNQINSDPGQNMNTLKLLVRAARRHGTTLTLMHKGMQKRLWNTTRFNQKKDKIFWKIHFVFALSPEFESRDLLSADLHITNDSRMLAYLASRRPSHINESGSQSAVQIGVVGATVDRVDEDKTLMEVINSVLEPQLGQDSTIAYTLRRLRINREALLCLIQQIPSPATDPIFNEVLLSQSIRNALEGRTIIEYPTFVVSTANNLKHVRRMLATVAEESNSNIGELSSNPKKSSLRDSSGGGPAIIAPQKKSRRVGDEDVGESFSATAVLLGSGMGTDLHIHNEEASSSEDDEDNAGNVGDSGAMKTHFLETLKQLESADLAQLSAIITEEESKLIGN